MIRRLASPEVQPDAVKIVDCEDIRLVNDGLIVQADLLPSTR
jgi:hypothetical protein